MNHKVTIIVPFYNSEKFIRKNIESCVEQTYKNIEIILVDDGSPDNCGAICDEYALKDKRIRVIHQKNGGVSVARNNALDIAMGEWVCFVDGDDFIMPDYVEYLLKIALDNHAEISLTTEIFTLHSIDKPLTPQIKKDHISLVTGEDATESILLYNQPIGPWCKLFRRDFIEGLHLRFIPKMFNGEGFNFNTYAFQRANKVAVGHKRLYVYRRDNPNSGTVEPKIEHCRSILWGISQIEKDLYIKSKRIKRAFLFAKFNSNSHVLVKLIRWNKTHEYRQMYENCRKISRKYALNSLFLPIRFRQKVRAVAIWFNPDKASVMFDNLYQTWRGGGILRKRF